MHKTEIINYLSRLLNKEINVNQFITLSSAQKVRFISWCDDLKITINDEKLSGRFKVDDLISGGVVVNYSDIRSVNKQVNVTNGNFQTGIGIDIQSIGELFSEGLPLNLKDDNSLLAIFTKNELIYAAEKTNPLETLTGLFCAKEAIQKCSRKKVALSDLEITHGSNGEPKYQGYSLSISHSNGFAVSIAISLENIPQNINSGVRFDASGPPLTEIRGDSSLKSRSSIVVVFIFFVFSSLLNCLITFNFVKYALY